MVTLVLDDGLEAVLQKIGDAKVRHPVELDRKLVGFAVVFTFTDDGAGNVTVTLSERGTHIWPFASAPMEAFDDRMLA